MFGSQPIERLLGAPDGPNSVSTSVCTSSAVTAAAAAACCLPRRRSISTIDRSPSSDAAPRCSTRAAIIIGRSVRRAAAETFQLTSLTVQLLQFLGLGLNWMSKFFLLMTYSLLLMPGFLQVMWYYFFSPNVRRSIPYGRLPRNSLDIFVPASPSPRPRPVVIFITGGAWIIGYKAWGTLLAQALEERGVIVASIDYRNFPQATVSGMLDDVTRGIGWVLQNIHRYGGDPSRVHLAGQSAGAHLSSVAIIRQALMRASEAPPSEQQHNLSPFGSNLQQPQQQHQQQQQQDQKQQHLAVEGESSCSGVVVSVAETAAGKTEIRYPSASLAPFAPAAAASAKVHPVDAWRVNAAAASASAAVTISDVPVTSFPETGHRAPASLPVLATCADSGHPASPFPLPAAAVFPPVSSAVSPADPQAPPAAGLRGEKEAAAEALRAGTPLFRSLSMRRLLAHLAGSGGAEGNEPGRGVLDVWGSEEIKSFIGVSGCYNLINLEPQFESRGMNPYLFLSIFEGEESLPLFSPELLVSRPTFKAAAPLLPPVHLYHGVDDISVPFTARYDTCYSHTCRPPAAPLLPPVHLYHGVDDTSVPFTAR
ncbi:unnamed protein product [Closterium sp. NIES-65]|nr:unnamed protein product [Closterium sp. NIES-65]